VGIMVSTQAHHECNFKRYSDGEAGVWCGNTVASGGIAFFTAMFGSSLPLLNTKFWKGVIDNWGTCSCGLSCPCSSRGWEIGCWASGERR